MKWKHALPQIVVINAFLISRHVSGCGLSLFVFHSRKLAAMNLILTSFSVTNTFHGNVFYIFGTTRNNNSIQLIYVDNPYHISNF